MAVWTKGHVDEIQYRRRASDPVKRSGVSAHCRLPDRSLLPASHGYARDAAERARAALPQMGEVPVRMPPAPRAHLPVLHGLRSRRLFACQITRQRSQPK